MNLSRLDYYFDNNFEEELAYLDDNLNLSEFSEPDKKTFNKIVDKFRFLGYPTAESIIYKVL